MHTHVGSRGLDVAAEKSLSKGIPVPEFLSFLLQLHRFPCGFLFLPSLKCQWGMANTWLVLAVGLRTARKV